jgi:peptidyl-prolyl cis-trans isomerase D
MAIRQVEAGLSQTGFASKASAALISQAFYQRREVQLVKFEPKDFANKVNLTDADLEAYYQSQQSAYSLPEQAQVEYVVLDLEAVKKSIALPEADLKSYYDQNVERLSGTEERRASHILITSPKDASEADRAKARAKAEDLLQQLKKAPASFAGLARQYSQDPGSANLGGDLNFFARGTMTKPFEDAAFALKKDELSDVVESDFGFHLIKLTDLKVPKRKSFDELRASIEADLKNQMARAKFAETAEAFANGVYEQSDSLKPVADKFKLNIQKANGVTPQAQPGIRGPLANPRLLAALFSEDVLRNKRNTEAVEVGPSQLAAARVLDYQASKVQPLAEVRASVRAALVSEKSAELAQQEGQKQLAALAAQPQDAKWPAAVTVSRDQQQALDPKISDAVLRADAAKLPKVVGVDLAGQGYVIARVLRIVDRAPSSPEQAKQEQAQIAQWWAQAEKEAHFAALKAQFKVSKKAVTPTP